MAFLQVLLCDACLKNTMPEDWFSFIIRSSRA